MRIIIIGSGIAGLTAAIGLRQAGHDAQIYERAPELTEAGAGISLWSNALRAFERIGVLDAVMSQALRFGRSQLRVRNGFTTVAEYSALRLEADLGRSPLMAMIHRADLVGALARFVPAEVQHFGHTCTGLKQFPDHAEVIFQNGRTVQADLVIGADGIRSAVRHALFGPGTIRYSGYTCWRGISARPRSLEPGYVGEWWGRGRRLGITTIPDDRIYWFATRNTPPDGHAADEKALVMETFRGWAEPAEEILADTPADKILRNDICDRAPSLPWSVGRVILIGDAAHSTTPNLGQGGCMAVEDGIILTRILSQKPDIPQALERFAAERFPRTSAVTQESLRIGKLGQIQGRTACFLRDRALQVLMPMSGTGNLLKHTKFDVGPLQ